MGFWPKALILLTNGSWISLFILWIYFLNNKMEGGFQGFLAVLCRLILVVNFGQFIRLVRVQVQLSAA